MAPLSPFPPPGFLARLQRVLAWAGLFAAGCRAVAAITVATYNLENYVAANRMADGVYRTAYPKPESEKAALRGVVAALAPDVLAVQEIGPAPYLEELRRELRAAGRDFPHAALLEAADPDRHVAVLSRLPFKEVRQTGRLPLAGGGGTEVVKRGVLEAVFATTTGEFSLFVVHLKSRHTETPEDPESARWRLREAEAVRDHVLARHPDPAAARFLICGDWNDTRGSRPVRALQRRGRTEVGELLAAADSRGETWTHAYRKEGTYSRVDYFLVSPALRPFVVGGSATVWDGAGVDAASDHRPVVLRLALEPQ
jgi:endonuclease/exonuclease/phosphatase family metal-dependent hydrolase